MIPVVLQHLSNDHNEWQVVVAWLTDFWPMLRLQLDLLRLRLRGWRGR